MVEWWRYGSAWQNRSKAERRSPSPKARARVGDPSLHTKNEQLDVCVQTPVPQGSGLTNSEYEDVLRAYEPSLTQDRYEQNMITNVRLGFAMCGLPIPGITTFSDALTAASDLEGKHAIVQS